MEDKQFRIFIDDPIFRRLHLPYPPQEKAKLKRQIIQEGYTKPFLTWSGVLLADFDAYDICFAESIGVTEKKTSFPKKEIAIDEMCKYQLENHPFLTPTMRKYLAGRRFLIEKKLGKDQAKEDKTKAPPKRKRRKKYDYESSALKIRERLAKDFNVTSQTIYKYGVYAELLDKVSGADDSFFFGVVSEQIRMSENTLNELVNLPARERKERIQELTGTNVPAEPEKEECTNSIKENTAEEVEKVEQPASSSARVGSIKHMPEYDPDAEVETLFYTVPSWSGSLKKVRDKTDVSRASYNVKHKLRRELIQLIYLVADILLTLEEENDGSERKESVCS